MDYIAQAIDKNTGFFKTSTITDKEGAIRTAKYYRSIGYNAKVYPANEEYDKACEAAYQIEKEQRRLCNNRNT